MSVVPKIYERGSAISHDTISYIPADQQIRPLRDRLIVEALDTLKSRILIVPEDGRTVRGIVRAAGPGRYRLAYDAPRRFDTDPYDPQRRKRKLVWETKTWIPTQVQVGDEVRLEGLQYDAFFWGDRYCVSCSEQDVCGIVAEPPRYRHTNRADRGAEA